MTVPNLLSMLRLALVPVFLLLLINEKFILAICTLALASLTDFLDGYLLASGIRSPALGSFWTLQQTGSISFLPWLAWPSSGKFRPGLSR